MNVRKWQKQKQKRMTMIMIMIMTVRSNEWKYDLMKRRLVHDSIEVESLYIKTLPAAAQPFRWRCGVVQLAKAFVWRGTSSACCGWKHGLHHHVSDFAPQSRHCVAGLLVTQRKEFSAVCTAVSVHTRGQIYHTISAATRPVFSNRSLPQAEQAFLSARPQNIWL